MDGREWTQLYNGNNHIKIWWAEQLKKHDVIIRYALGFADAIVLKLETPFAK